MHPGHGTSPEPLWLWHMEKETQSNETRVPTEQAWVPVLVPPLTVQPQARVSMWGPGFLLSGLGAAGLPGSGGTHLVQGTGAVGRGPG